jgi:predicted RNase H-like nuclease (RuvC/YqgF family)
VESLQEQTSELRKKIDDQHDLNSQRAMQQQDTLARLASTLAEKRTSADSAERKLQQCNNILQKQLQGIDHIFHIVRCSAAPILSLLGEYKQYIITLPLGMFGCLYIKNSVALVH